MRTREVFGVSILLSLSILLGILLAGCECCKKKDACPQKACAPQRSARCEMAYADSGTDYAKRNLIEVAADEGKLKIFIKAVEAAGLTDTLKEKGPFTVFAPTDRAFNQLPVGKLESLFKPENKAELRRILRYHVADEQVLPTDVRGRREVQTLEGQPLRLLMQNGVLWAGSSRVLMANLRASNGVIHVVDAVIMPPAEEKE